MGKKIIFNDDFSANAIDTVTPPNFEFAKDDLDFISKYVIVDGDNIGGYGDANNNWFHSEPVDCSDYNKLSMYSAGGHVGLFYDANNEPLQGILVAPSTSETAIIIPKNYADNIRFNAWYTINIPAGAKTIVFNWCSADIYALGEFKWILSNE